MPAISIKNMSVSYTKGRTKALNKFSLEIKDGELCVFLGPSGCGKTTALHCVAGLINPEEGEIKIGDATVTSSSEGIFLRPQDRNIAMVFQEYALYPNMSVRGNLSFALETMKVSKEQTKSRVEETAQMLGISELLDRRPSQLSGGQRQRVALGRALVRKPQVFLLDEPLGNLDAKLRDQVRFDLKRLQRSLKVTTIYVTHDQIEAMTLADTVVLMKDGLVVQKGTPEELYSEPRNTFVAGFVGTPQINLVECGLKDKGTLNLLDSGDFVLPVSMDLKEQIARKANEKVIVGIRPSDFHLAGESDPFAIEGRIEVTEQLGDAVLLHVSVGNNVIRAKLPAHEVDLKKLSSVRLSVRPEKLHIFDSKTGDRIWI